MAPRPSSLPPNRLIQLGRWGWTQVWHVMMAQMAPRRADGSYDRPPSPLRHRVSTAPEAPFPAEAGRYQLIVGLGCPWAHRTLVVRALKGLEAAIPILLVTPKPEAGGWVFQEPLEDCATLAQFYQQLEPGYAGRSTVPLLWDTQTRRLVNNESADLIVLLNSAWNAVADRPELDLYPDALRDRIEDWNERIYTTVNNGVYRCGFAQTQAAYDQAVQDLFATLGAIETVLAQQRYLCGPDLTLADVRLFTTLIRFDAVYHGLFKCNRRRIADYPHLSGYLRDLYQLPGIAATFDGDVVLRDYYGNLFPLNPGGIIPIGPDWSALLQPHDRDR